LFRMGNTGEVSWSDVLRKSKAARVILRLGGERGWWPAERKNVHRAPGPEDWKRLAREAAGAYLRMVSTANATFRANGAHPIFVLQPTIFAKRELVPDEKRMVESNQGWKD